MIFWANGAQWDFFSPCSKAVVVEQRLKSTDADGIVWMFHLFSQSSEMIKPIQGNFAYACLPQLLIHSCF